jgi:hypothetical protein
MKKGRSGSYLHDETERSVRLTIRLADQIEHAVGVKEPAGPHGNEQAAGRVDGRVLYGRQVPLQNATRQLISDENAENAEKGIEKNACTS